MSETKKEKNIAYFKSQLPSLLTQPIYKDKFVIVSGEKIQGAYDTFQAALGYAVAHFSNDEFVIQEVIADSDRINFLKAAI